MNATAVAEQAVLLMLGLLCSVVSGDRAVREGRQIDVKLAHMATGDLKEISDCCIGFVGFGDIGKATAKLCSVMGAEIVYTKHHPLLAEEEKEYNLKYLPLDELLATSDIVTLHTPVTAETVHMADKEFFAKMKEGSYLINTARGDLVVAEDLVEVIKSGHLSGAGLDCIEGEPVKTDNPMLQLDPDTASKILFSPHVG